MPVLLDTNVLISYLLSGGGRHGVVGEIPARFLAGEFTLLLPEALLEEVLETVRRNPALAARIAPADLEAFIVILQSFGEPIPRIEETIPAVTRNPKDDYLLAYALVGRADFLVSGDKDLLALQELVRDVAIVTPRQFVDGVAG